MQRNRLLTILGLMAALYSAGCSPQTVDAPRRVDQPAAQASVTRQEAFLARIKQASSTNGVVVDARMNGDDELGVVFGKQVKLNQVRPLMTTLLREMRDEFPGRHLTLIGYAPNGKPMATMRYNPSAPANANTTFTPNY